MNWLFTKSLRVLRRIYIKLFKPEPWLGNSNGAGVSITGQEASDLIKKRILNNEPLMVCRFGSTEINAMINSIHEKKSFSSILNYITGKYTHIVWNEFNVSQMNDQSGFFPSNHENIDKFTTMMLNDLKEVDILASWRNEEKFFSSQLENVPRIRLHDLNAYIQDDPWSSALEGKKVLVIHPFEESIQNQFKKRSLLFKNPRVLPEFELVTIKAVQSLLDAESGFDNWFDALESMKEKVDRLEFDIALIGCGAYGFPLAAHVKRKGKKAIHLGGVTQLFFGIKGRRWELEYDFEKTLYNEHWVRPLPQEVPENHKKLEKGAYW